MKLRVYKFKHGKRKMIRLVSRRYVGPQWTPHLARQVQEDWPLLHEGPVPPQQAGSVYKPSTSGFRNFRVKR